MINQHKTYKTLDNKWLYPSEVFYVNNQPFYQNPATLQDEEIIIGRSEKMSKSKKNTVDPAKIYETYGADTARNRVLPRNASTRRACVNID